MTTIDQAREAVYQAFDAAWGSRTVRQLEGVVFTEPGPDVEWIRIVVRNLAGTTNTMGDVGFKQHRRNATVLMTVFTPSGAGMAMSGQHAQYALDIFESKNIDVTGGDSRLDFITGDIREIPLDAEDKSRMTEIEIPFDFTQTK